MRLRIVTLTLLLAAFTALPLAHAVPCVMHAPAVETMADCPMAAQAADGDAQMVVSQCFKNLDGVLQPLTEGKRPPLPELALAPPAVWNAPASFIPQRNAWQPPDDRSRPPPNVILLTARWRI